jgi:hypothetical protein
MRRRYALLCYSNTTNLGDEIQSLAARQFLPSVDLLVDRERLHTEGETGRRHRIILNGWFMHRPEHWPPHHLLKPLITSWHLSDEIFVQNVFRQRALDVLLSSENLPYLEKHAPIGARDSRTLELLQRRGIDAYFSGCLTLTLTAAKQFQRRDFVCLNDLDPELSRCIELRAARPVVITSHDDRETVGFHDRAQKAQQLLSLYTQARYVVTSRLHCALPCLALETPVLFVPNEPDGYRFSGLLSLLHHCSREDLLADRQEFDLGQPSANPGRYLPLRERLMQQCASFVSGRFWRTQHFAPAI